MSILSDQNMISDLLLNQLSVRHFSFDLAESPDLSIYSVLIFPHSAALTGRLMHPGPWRPPDELMIGTGKAPVPTQSTG